MVINALRISMLNWKSIQVKETSFTLYNYDLTSAHESYSRMSDNTEYRQRLPHLPWSLGRDRCAGSTFAQSTLRTDLLPHHKCDDIGSGSTIPNIGIPSHKTVTTPTPAAQKWIILQWSDRLESMLSTKESNSDVATCQPPLPVSRACGNHRIMPNTTMHFLRLTQRRSRTDTNCFTFKQSHKYSTMTSPFSPSTYRSSSIHQQTTSETEARTCFATNTDTLPSEAITASFPSRHKSRMAQTPINLLKKTEVYVHCTN